MNKQLYSKFDNVIAIFNKFVENNHTTAEKEDQLTKTQWTNLKNLFN
jgi:hypothetical protein